MTIPPENPNRTFQPTGYDSSPASHQNGTSTPSAPLESPHFYTSTAQEDEELARRLQAEEDAFHAAERYRQAQLEQQRMKREQQPSPPTKSQQTELDNHDIASNTINNVEGTRMELADEEYARRLAQELSLEDSNGREDEDLRLAREMQRMEEMEARRLDSTNRPPAARRLDINRLPPAAISPVNPAAVEDEDEDEDVKLARAIQAEEALQFNEARLLRMELEGGAGTVRSAQTAEDIRRDQEAAMALQRQVIAQGHENRGYCTRKRICSALFMSITIVAGTLLVLFFGSSIWTRAGGDPDNLPPFFRDTWGGPATGGDDDFAEWRSNGKGLNLVVTNHLTEDWFDFFQKAFLDWNACPALELRARVSEVIEPDCVPQKGTMKVCNSAYGRTGWTGLNEVYFEGGYITSSVAKMNESYLKTAPDAEKQYVMCHELGHGFGLPHRDENPNNRDLGSCLDYTTRPENNIGPDEVDCGNLERLYGTVKDNVEKRKRQVMEIKDKEEIGFLRNQRKINVMGNRAISTEITINEEEQHGRILPSQGRIHSYKNGRLLKRTKYSEVYVSDYNENVKVVTHVLF